MLFVANAQQQITRVTRRLFVLVAAALFSALSVSIPVYATGTTVNAVVRDNLPLSLTVTSNIEGAVVTLPTVMLDGTVHNATQIIVYVDNAYSTSMPLAAGAETYTVAFGVTPGVHEVRIVGLDSYTNTEVSQTVRFAYEPTATSGSGETTSGAAGSSSVDNYVNQTINAANATKEDVAQKVNQASSSGPLGALSDAMFSVFKSVDLVSATDGTGIDKMAGRFTLVSAGLAASVFPWSAYALVEKLRFVPKFVVPNGMVLASVRVVGIGLMLIPFIFIH